MWFFLLEQILCEWFCFSKNIIWVLWFGTNFLVKDMPLTTTQSFDASLCILFEMPDSSSVTVESKMCVDWLLAISKMILTCFHCDIFCCPLISVV